LTHRAKPVADLRPRGARFASPWRDERRASCNRDALAIGGLPCEASRTLLIWTSLLRSNRRDDRRPTGFKL